jgi:membrane associated rhomboid family serine protease
MLIPYKAEDGRDDLPVITALLIGLNVLVHIALAINIGEEAPWVWGFIPETPRFATLVSSIFVHADFIHLTGNMLFLWVYGGPLERAIGPLRYLLLYLAFGLAATLFFWMKTPSFSADMPLVGASGAIAGVMGGFFVVHPGVLIRCVLFLFVYFGTPRLPAWLILGFWFLTQWIDGQVVSTGVAYEAHIGGFVAGFLTVAFVWHGRGFMKAFRRAEIERVDATSFAPDAEGRFREAAALVADSHDDLALNFWYGTRAAAVGRDDEAVRVSRSCLRHLPASDRKFRMSCYLLRLSAAGMPKTRPEMIEFENLCRSFHNYSLAANVLERLIAAFPNDSDRRAWNFRLARTYLEELDDRRRGQEMTKRIVEENAHDEVARAAQRLLGEYRES